MKQTNKIKNRKSILSLLRYFFRFILKRDIAFIFACAYGYTVKDLYPANHIWAATIIIILAMRFGGNGDER